MRSDCISGFRCLGKIRFSPFFASTGRSPRHNSPDSPGPVPYAVGASGSHAQRSPLHHRLPRPGAGWAMRPWPIPYMAIPDPPWRRSSRPEPGWTWCKSGMRSPAACSGTTDASSTAISATQGICSRGALRRHRPILLPRMARHPGDSGSQSAFGGAMRIGAMTPAWKRPEVPLNCVTLSGSAEDPGIGSRMPAKGWRTQ